MRHALLRLCLAVFAAVAAIVTASPPLLALTVSHMANPNRPGVPTSPPAVIPVGGFVQLLPPAIVQAFRAGRIVLDFYMYEADFLPLPLSSAGTQVDIQTSGDADFLMLYTMAYVTDTATPPVAVTLANAAQTVLLLDSTSGRQFMSSAVPIASMFGTAQLPHVLMQPKLIPGGATFSVKVANLDNVARNVRLTFAGCKIFPYQNTQAVSVGH